MTDLSPAAQAVTQAIDKVRWDWGNMQEADASIIAAAALRATADQVAPSDADEPRNYLPMAIECQRIRCELLAIAAELDGTNNTESPHYD